MTRVLDAGKTHCSTTSLGTITHVAPEVLLSGKQTKAGDVYSYGLLSECRGSSKLNSMCGNQCVVCVGARVPEVLLSGKQTKAGMSTPTGH
jgi:serine/threonine protein kinase